MIPTTFVSVSFLYEAAEKGEEKEERKKEERTRVKTMVSQVATHSARNSPVPIMGGGGCKMSCNDMGKST